MKITVVGAGSTYTPGLISRWYETKKDRIKVDEFCLYDINKDRLDTVGNYIIESYKKICPDVKITKTLDLDEATSNVDYVIIQIRSGLNTQRAIDEMACVKHGFVGQETTGPGGWALALRQIPAALEVAKAVEKNSPDAWIISVANPASILAEGLIKYGHAKTIGMCHGGFFPRTLFARLLDVDESRISFDYWGLNHLAWIPEIRIDGVPITKEQNIELAKKEYAEWRAHETSLPDSFAEDYYPYISVHHYMREFFTHDEVVEECRQRNATRGTRVIEIEKNCLEYYKKYAGIRSDVPPELSKRGGDIEDGQRKKTHDFGAIGYSDGCMNVIDALSNKDGMDIIINVLNKGAISDLPDDAVVECLATVKDGSYELHKMGELPIGIRGHVQMVKAYETMTATAAATGDRALALQALMSNPICFCHYARTKELFNELMELNKEFLPQFK